MELDKRVEDLSAPGGWRYLHRYMTVRETARVMTFPDKWVGCGPRGEQMRQLGNAVPVVLGEFFARGGLARLGRGRTVTPATWPAEHAGRWKESLLPSAPTATAGAAAPAVEQDRAAGGRHRRAVDLGDGRYARASIALKLYRRTRRIRAYLRWSCDGVTRERYVCEVDHLTRGENLAEAWRQARLMGLVTDPPPPEGSTASSQAVRAVMRANRGRTPHRSWLCAGFCTRAACALPG